MSLPTWMMAVQWTVIVFAGTGLSGYSVVLTRHAQRERAVAGFKEAVVADAEYLSRGPGDQASAKVPLEVVGSQLRLAEPPHVIHKWFKRELAEQSRSLRRSDGRPVRAIRNFVAVVVLRQRSGSLAVLLIPLAARSYLDAFNDLAPSYGWPPRTQLDDGGGSDAERNVGTAFWISPDDHSIVFLVPDPRQSPPAPLNSA